MVLKSFLNAFATKDFTNGIKYIGASRIWKPMLGAKKPTKNDMDKFNPYEVQAIHFTS